MTNFDVQVMRADGTGRRRLTTGPHREIDARWSPDGRTISFTRMLDTSGRVTSIWLMNADGTHKRRVASGGEARWSPNGRELLFSRFDARDRLNLFVLNLATRRVVQLTKSPQYDEPGDWSPDGSAIVFSREGANADVYRVRPDGTGLRRLTRGPADDYACCFAPDGRSIAFTSNRSGHQQVWTMRADGTHLRNASRSVSDDEATQWHP
jgi:TolB protein